MNPGGTPRSCVHAAPVGSTVDFATGRCVGLSGHHTIENEYWSHAVQQAHRQQPMQPMQQQRYSQQQMQQRQQRQHRQQRLRDQQQWWQQQEQRMQTMMACVLLFVVCFRRRKYTITPRHNLITRYTPDILHVHTGLLRSGGRCKRRQEPVRGLPAYKNRFTIGQASSIDTSSPSAVLRSGKVLVLLSVSLALVALGLFTANGDSCKSGPYFMVVDFSQNELPQAWQEDRPPAEVVAAATESGLGLPAG